MRKIIIIKIILLTLILGIQVETVKSQSYCNPINLSYPLILNQQPNRDINDPSIVLFKNNYFLFATNSGGYWVSGDLLSWKFITPERMPLLTKEPVSFVIGEWLYFTSSSNDTIYRSNNPAAGKWEVYNTSMLISAISDFAIFVDTDGRVYSYYGCTNNDGIMSRELDAKNGLNPIKVPIVCKKINSLNNSKVKPKVDLKKTVTSSVRGSWMNKYNGKYYYQSTEFNPELGIFCDVVYVSDKPIGPFTYAPNNPISFLPDGFIRGAGNGSTFADKYGNWWHVATVTSASKNDPKPRLGLFPAGFDKDGILFTKTDFGDYPIRLPSNKYFSMDKLNPGWSLLSFEKDAEASTSMASCPTTSAFDEDFSTYWSARTGKKGEWLSVNLGSVCTINAIQLNFAENNKNFILQDSLLTKQYLVQYSKDNKIWEILIDKTRNTEDLITHYKELNIPIQAKYLKITNYSVPNGTFAISGFRVFGSAEGRKPKKVDEFRGIRDYKEKDITKLFWDKQNNTVGYNIRYGTQKDKLYHSMRVYKNTPLKVRCPDKISTYWFAIDAFNESGVTPGKEQMTH